VEVQGTGEAGTFSRAQMGRMLALANKGLRELRKVQQRALPRKSRRQG
jgi:ribonuclease PH